VTTDTIQAELRQSQAKLLQKEFCVVDVRSKVPVAELMPHLHEHHAYIEGLEESGRIFACGPVLLDGDEPNGDSIWIVRGTLAEAEAAAAEDPLTKLGLRDCSVRRWRANMGGFTLAVRFSAGTFDLD
jgi:uncharacterized protein YciI